MRRVVRAVLEISLPNHQFVPQSSSLWSTVDGEFKIFNLGPFTSIYKNDDLQLTFDEEAYEANRIAFYDRIGDVVGSRDLALHLKREDGCIKDRLGGIYGFVHSNCE
ncbi:hypothetical protein A6E01_19945 (plasmid) [Vibrio breoganii]|uniref:Uncharacterized protein n=1 Tax=Vibrio breoganii TaxID=553239 RepID=A0AAN0XZA1_9VIBR|nr:hypothetical protein [Vibrio breoganii]ANO35487.1 hypothetical protein A6E01_19945 [Vibrio breoganii]PML13802.1 hypothetical protein BCT84_12480 [Vibrio breoganii]